MSAPSILPLKSYGAVTTADDMFSGLTQKPGTIYFINDINAQYALPSGATWIPSANDDYNHVNGWYERTTHLGNKHYFDIVTGTSVLVYPNGNSVTRGFTNVTGTTPINSGIVVSDTVLLDSSREFLTVATTSGTVVFDLESSTTTQKYTIYLPPSGYVSGQIDSDYPYPLTSYITDGYPTGTGWWHKSAPDSDGGQSFFNVTTGATDKKYYPPSGKTWVASTKTEYPSSDGWLQTDDSAYSLIFFNTKSGQYGLPLGYVWTASENASYPAASGWWQTTDTDQHKDLYYNKLTGEQASIVYWYVEWLAWDGSEVSHAYVKDGGNVAEPLTAPVQDASYAFSNWDATSTNVTKNLTIHAVYTRVYHTVTYRVRDASGTYYTYDTESFLHGTSEEDVIAHVDTADLPVYTDHVFSEWDIDLGDSGLTEDVTISALYNIETVAVTFDANGGTVDGYSQKDYDIAVNSTMNSTQLPNSTNYLSYFTTAGGPTNAPVQDGYVFAGWSSSQTGDIVKNTNFRISSNTKYYARWVPNSSVGTRDFAWGYVDDSDSPNFMKYILKCTSNLKQEAPDGNSKVEWEEVFDFSENSLLYVFNENTIKTPHEGVFKFYVKSADGEYFSNYEINPYQDPERSNLNLKFSAYGYEYKYTSNSDAWEISEAKHLRTVFRWSSSSDTDHTKSIVFGPGSGYAYYKNDRGECITVQIDVVDNTTVTKTFTLAANVNLITFGGDWTFISPSTSTGESDSDNGLRVVYDYSKATVAANGFRGLTKAQYINLGAAKTLNKSAIREIISSPNPFPLIVAPNATSIGAACAYGSKACMVFPAATSIHSDNNSFTGSGCSIRFGTVETASISKVSGFPWGASTSGSVIRSRFFGSDGTEDYFVFPNGAFPNPSIKGNSVYLDGTWYTIPSGYSAKTESGETYWENTDTGDTYYLDEGWVGKYTGEWGKAYHYEVYNLKTEETVSFSISEY